MYSVISIFQILVVVLGEPSGGSDVHYAKKVDSILGYKNCELIY